MLDALISPLIKKGQSIHHVLANNPDRFDLHQKTIYRYVAGGLLAIKNGDRPRVCMLKPRTRKPVEHKIDTRWHIGQTHENDTGIHRRPPEWPVEMDTSSGAGQGRQGLADTAVHPLPS